VAAALGDDAGLVGGLVLVRHRLETGHGRAGRPAR
jgi:hypothetical protein